MASRSQPILLTGASGPASGRLFEDWSKPLLRFLLCSGLTADHARDIVQETFLRLHQHLEAGGAQDNLRAWVFRAANNAALNDRKSGARRLSRRLEACGEVACPRDDPERLLLRKERFRRLHRAMKELSAVERHCVLLRAEGLRYREIADALEIGTSTVADHLERALRKLGENCSV